MKNVISILICLAGLFLWSCMDEERQAIEKEGGFTLNYSVLGQGAETQTKTVVAAEDGEEKINSLYLLFFNYTENASGKFITYYEVEGNLSMNSSVAIPFSNYPELKNNESYVILAVANLDQAEYISQTADSWIASMAGGKTEGQVIESFLLYIQGANQDESDDSHAILPSELLMSGRTIKQAEVKEVNLDLTRGLVRFDVQNLWKEKFDLVSVSIWNAAVNAPVWSGDKYDIPGKIARYYGIKRSSVEDDDTLEDIKGGLYSFENFVSSPQVDDKETTCLIVGLAPKTSKLDDNEKDKFKSGITYHRINVHPEDGGQNIKRNYVYKVSINSVRGEGESSEYDAWSKGTNNLNLVINNWNLDENGLILTDGKNTLVIPVKRVVLDPVGDQREYSIYTLGEGSPSISKYEMPSEITANLTGNRLIVTALPMAQGEDERKGMIEISLGSLRGEINFIQTENADEFLSLNLSQLSAFPAVGINPIPDGYIEVTSSGTWKAIIYNNDPLNPGFSFTTSGAAVTNLTLDENYGSNYVQIYTTGANPTADPRYSFVIFSLEDNPEINRSLVLMQRGLPDLQVTPDVSSFTFQPNGQPSTVMQGYTDGDYVVFDVKPGSDGSTLNAWTASLVNDTKNQFEIEVYSSTDLSEIDQQKVKVKSKGLNLHGETVSASLQFFYQGETTPEKSIQIRQSAIGLKLNHGDALTYTVLGGESQNGISLEADESFTYTAEIISCTDLANPTVQGGYLIGDNGEKLFGVNAKVTRRSIDQILKVGFAKLLTPNVDVTVEMTVRVSIDGYGHLDDMFKEFTVTQTALTAKGVYGMNTNAGGRGYINNSTGYDYNFYYNRALRNPNISGNNSYYYMPNSFTLPENYTAWGRDRSETIPSTITHVNAHYLQGILGTTSSSIVNWLKANEGILVINFDFNGNNDAWNSGRIFSLLGNYARTNPSGAPRINTAAEDTKLYKYIFEDGPFGKVNVGNITGWGYDPERVVLFSYPSTAVPIVVDGNGSAQILIDPVNRVVFNGELQIFHTDGTPANRYDLSNGVTTDYHRFLANYMSFIHSVSMYGSHFTDHFLDEVDTVAPYYYKK